MSSTCPNWGKDCKDCKHHVKEYNEEPCWNCINHGIMQRLMFEPLVSTNKNDLTKELK
jgi:hypothetical protein